jgi:predicted O-methyltransferase YrrM
MKKTIHKFLIIPIFLVKAMRTFINKVTTRREMSRLRGRCDSISQSLVSAISAVLKNETSIEEKTWIERIEALRASLERSTSEITFLDYGARSPDMHLEAQEMYRGTRVTRTVADLCRHSSMPQQWGLLLFKLIREFRPSVCFELGTCMGISTAYLSAALELNCRGKVTTLEGGLSLASLARDNLRKLDLKRFKVVCGRFQDTLQKALRDHPSVDFAFIDGHHDERATMEYFESFLPFLAEGAVLVFDDISWSRGMRRVWKSIAAHKRIRVSVDLLRVGVCILSGAHVRETKSRYRIML